MSNILIAEDEPDMRALLSDLLEEAGHDVVEAQDGHEALRKLQGDLPDLVLLDVLMPEMNGLQVLERLRSNARTEELPVILMTAFSLSDEQVGIAGAPQHLPFNQALAAGNGGIGSQFGPRPHRRGRFIRRRSIRRTSIPRVSIG